MSEFSFGDFVPIGGCVFVSADFSIFPRWSGPVSKMPGLHRRRRLL